MAGTLGNLIVQISADVGRLRGDMRRAETTVDRAMSGIRRSAGLAVRALGALGIGLSVAGLASFASQTVQAADDINKLSTRLGASTEALSQYQFVAQQTGVAFNQLTTALQRMSRRVSEAARGTGEAKDALRELGVDAEKLTELRPEQQFEVLADAFAQIEGQSDRVRLAFKLFDSEGVRLLQTMEGGADAIRALREEADELGLTLDQDTADAASRIADEFGRLGSASAGAGLQLLDTFGPAIEATVGALTDGIREVQAFTRSLGDLVDAVASLDAEQIGASIVRGLIPGDIEASASIVGRIAGALGFEDLAAEARIAAGGQDALAQASRGTASALDDAVDSADFFDASLKRLSEDSENAAKAAERHAEAVAKLEVSTLEGLRREAAAVQELSRAEQIAFEVREGRLRETSDAFQDQATALAEQIDAQRAILALSKQRADAERDLAAEAARVQESVLTDAERQTAEIAKLDRLFAAQAISAETYRRAVEQAREETDDLSSVAEDLGLTFSSAFEDAIVNGRAFSDVLRGLEQDILRILTRKLVTEPLAGALTEGLGEVLPGFQHGGSFAVGGSGGIDSQMVAFRATPGEQVTVSPPGESRGDITVNMTVQTPDANSFRRSAGQILSDTQAQLRRAAFRNG